MHASRSASLRAAAAVAATAACAALVASLSLPVSTSGFSLTGESLGLDQRDARVFNNFLDATANDNAVPHPGFPGAVGAVLAIWKAHAEWGSGPWAGDGLGDGLASNANLGDGGANFDTVWQGESDGPGDVNGNVHSATPGLGGSLLAFTMTPVSDGWKIIYNEDLLWDDGPGVPAAGAIDLQGVATHEIGHTLGLGHSIVAGATMSSTVSGQGTEARSLAPDDIAGIQAIYGLAAASKPLVAALSGDASSGGALSIHGAQFAASGNEVWFTKQDSDGAPIRLTGLAGLAGGTRIDLVVPAGVQSGALHVRVPGGGGAALSNGFPVAIDAPPGAFALTEAPKAGSLGHLPLLSGEGDLSPGAGAFSLHLWTGLPPGFAVLFAGGGEANLPFKGGVFDPAPILVEVLVGWGASGAVVLGATMPAAVPSGFELVLQAFFADGAAVGGVAGSNGLRLTVP